MFAKIANCTNGTIIIFQIREVLEKIVDLIFEIC